MSIRLSWKTALALSVSLVLAACGGGGGGSPTESDADKAPLAEPSSKLVRSAATPDRVVAGVLDKKLLAAKGSVDVWVTLSEVPVAAAAMQLAKSTLTTGGLEQAQSIKSLRSAPQGIRSALQSHKASLLSHQEAAADRFRSLGGVELGRVHVAHNAIAVRVDASKLAQIAATPGVTKVRLVSHYEMSLSETVPYIGATAVQQAGFDGAGVRVAVIDSGIDYTHKNLGGAGTPEAYLAAYGTDPRDPRNTTIDPSVFPTNKVVGGYDFVGDSWGINSTTGEEIGERTEDPNPIDFQGHGTHVADIIGGKSLVSCPANT